MSLSGSRQVMAGLDGPHQVLIGHSWSQQVSAGLRGYRQVKVSICIGMSGQVSAGLVGS